MRIHPTLSVGINTCKNISGLYAMILLLRATPRYSTNDEDRDSNARSLSILSSS
jgi:hypothetical protein